MKNLILLVLFVSAVFASLEDQQQWNNFKTKHNKSYESNEEENLRFTIFQQNLRQIEEHNKQYEAGKATYKQGVNEFTDLTKQEFMSKLKRQNIGRPHANKKSVFQKPIGAVLPESMDWRDYGAVSKVKNQGSCGACWAFAAAGTIESFYYLKNNKMITLSEQQLLDCSKENYACVGGYESMAMYYIKENGIQSEQSYQYEAKASTCRYNESEVVVKIEDFVEIVDGKEEDMQAVVGLLGPVTVGFDATELMTYQEGVYTSNECMTDHTNHAGVAVGYGKDNVTGLDYWLVKNSWGRTWGEKGFFRIRRGSNECGIAIDSVYPIL